MGTASNEEIIYGKNAVTEALKAEKPIDTVFVLKGAQGMNQIIALAKKQGIVVKDAGEDKLKALCGIIGSFILHGRGYSRKCRKQGQTAFYNYM